VSLLRTDGQYGESMLEYSFSVRHEGCWTSDIHDEFPEFSATILQSHALSDSSSTMIEVDDIAADEADAIGKWMNEHPVVQTVDCIKHEEGSGLLSLQTDFSDTDTQPVGIVFREEPCIPLDSAEVRNGFEHCRLMLADKEQARNAYEKLREYGPVEIESLSEFDTDYQTSDLAAVSRAIASLSPRQQEVLRGAIEQGHYDVPQSCNVDELAENDSATMSTVAEHLRHAEHKVFDAIKPLLSSNETDP